jgi:hypothetical protein
MTNSVKAKENKKTSEDIAKQIIDASSYLNLCIDGHSGKDIDFLLAAAGFKIGKAYSICKVASFQEMRELNGKRVEIIDSNFMGIFTQIKVYTN